MSKYMTVADVADKIEWEGGILQTMEWGLTDTDILDPELSALWWEAIVLYDKLKPTLDKIRDYLDEHYEEEKV